MRTEDLKVRGQTGDSYTQQDRCLSEASSKPFCYCQKALFLSRYNYFVLHTYALPYLSSKDKPSPGPLRRQLAYVSRQHSQRCTDSNTYDCSNQKKNLKTMCVCVENEAQMPIEAQVMMIMVIL